MIFENSNIDEELPPLVDAATGAEIDLTDRRLVMDLELETCPGEPVVRFDTDDGSLSIKPGTTNVLIVRRLYDPNNIIKAGHYNFDIVEVLGAGQGQVRLGGGTSTVDSEPVDVGRGVTFP